MTEVSATSSSTSTSTASTVSSAATVDYESFLKLLVAELQNQDPTEPMDSTEYIAQLASFSNVEQSIQTNDKLDDLIQMSYLEQAGSYIGHTITSADGSVTGSISEVSVTSDGVTAYLDTGETVDITSGVTIS